MISNSPYNKDVDWWSFGILVYKMLFKITPFYNQNTSQTMNSILTESPEYPCRNDVSTNAIEFIDDLLQKDPNKRLGSGNGDVEDIKSHPFFNGLNWNDLLYKILKPEWVPPIKNDIDVSYFDDKFIQQTPVFSFSSDPVKKETQKYFEGFTCVKEDEL